MKYFLYIALGGLSLFSGVLKAEVAVSVSGIEEGKIAVRNIRRDALRKIHDYGKEENESEDEIKGRETDLQSITDKHIKDLDSHQENKEKELMEV